MPAPASCRVRMDVCGVHVGRVKMRGVTVNPSGETPDIGIPRRLAAGMTVGEQQEVAAPLPGPAPGQQTHGVEGRGERAGRARRGHRALGARRVRGGCGHTGRGVRAQAVVRGRPNRSDGRRRRADRQARRQGGARLRDRHRLRAGGRSRGSASSSAWFPSRTTASGLADQFFVHALADHLAPGATFHYRIRLADGTSTPDAVFTTAPARQATQPFTFTAFADQGVNTDPTPTGQTGFSDNYYKPDDTRRTAAPSDALVALVAGGRGPRSTCWRATSAMPTPAATGSPCATTGPRPPTRGSTTSTPQSGASTSGVIEKSAATTPWLFATGNHDMEALYDDNTVGRCRPRLRRARGPARPAQHRPPPGAPRSTRWSTATSACSAWTPTTCPRRSPPTPATAAGPS